MRYNGGSIIDKGKGDFKTNAYGVIFFSFLAGLYLVPEYIKLISIAFTFLLFTIAILNVSDKYRIRVTFFLWTAFILLGLLICIIEGIADIFDALEFIISILIGLLIQLL